MEINITPSFDAVSSNALVLASVRTEAHEAAAGLAGATRVAHAANVEYAKHLCAWAHSVDPNVVWFDLTYDDLKKHSAEIYAEAKAFRDGYVSTNISTIWKRIRETGKKYAEANALYGLAPNMLGDVADDEAEGEGTGSTSRTAAEVIESAEKNGGVWLYRNLARRDSLSESEAEFMGGLRELLRNYGLTDAAITG